MNRRPNSNSRRGGALLAVLWLSAALAAIAFSVAMTVRGEVERSETLVDGFRARALAAGAVNRGILYILWGAGSRNQDGTPKYYEPGLSRMNMAFPSGAAVVEVIPETARLSLNEGRAGDFARLALALGADAAQANVIAEAIVDWRSPAAAGSASSFDQYYLGRNPSFRGRHASIEETEEILYVRGMTPDLFYGNWTRDARGRLVRLGGFRDCVSPFGTTGAFDANSAEPALLLSIGVPPQGVEQIRQLRFQRPLRNQDAPLVRSLAGPAAARLRTGGNTIFTLRATARLRQPDGRLSETKRTVAATIKFFQQGQDPPYQILRWYDNAASEVANW